MMNVRLMVGIDSMHVSRLRAVGTLLVVQCALAGCGSSQECSTDAYPPAPDGATGVVHVAAGCSDGAADGSAEHPYPSIQQGVDHAQSGGAVLVAPGTYPENVTIGKPLSLIGAAPGGAAKDAPVVVQAPAAYSIVIDQGTTGVLLRGLALESPIAVGVWVAKDGAATLDGLRIEGAMPDAAGDYGFGALATDNGSIIICKSAITGSALVGVFFQGAKGEVEGGTIQDNHGRGGIRVEASTGVVSIHDNVFSGNDEAGIGVFSSNAVIADNTIEETHCGAAANMGDAIVVAHLSGGSDDFDVDVQGNTIQDSCRTGVLFSGGAKGSITNNQVSNNGAGAAFGAGIWAQASAGGSDGLEISGNEITGNRYLGIGLTSGARAHISQNASVDDTLAAPVFFGVDQVMIGDGVAVMKGAFAKIESNQIQGSGRFGVIFDEAAMGTTLTGNTIGGSDQYGYVVQHQDVVTLSISGNTLSNNGAGDSKIVAAAETPFGMKTDDLPTQ